MAPDLASVTILENDYKLKLYRYVIKGDMRCCDQTALFGVLTTYHGMPNITKQEETNSYCYCENMPTRGTYSKHKVRYGKL